VDVVVARWAGDALQIFLARRAAGTRCTGAWEIVHGRIESGERPEQAAVREVLEETGLTTQRLYNVTLGGFYLHQVGCVALSVVFCAVVDHQATPVLSHEHDAGEWLSLEQAAARCAWPREREALHHIAHLFRDGRDAGAVEDVLRVPLTS
jgi:dihydroneopterin triphosphate diphosphatase